MVKILIVDKREKDLDTLKRALFINGVEFKEATLEEGDFTDDTDSFIVERKRDFDILNSLTNKHIFVQLARMREKHPETPLFILFQGDYRALKASIRDAGLRALATAFPYKLAHIYGCQFIECLDQQDVVDTLIEISRYSKGIKDAKPVFEPIYMSKNFDERVRLLMSVPQMGQTRAEAALAKYSNIMNFVIACEDDPKEVMEMDGFGKKMVENVFKMFLGDEPFLKRLNKKKEEMTPEDREKDIAEKKQKHKIMRSAYSRRMRKRNANGNDK